MTSKQGVVVVSQDTFIKGDIRNCRQIEIYGFVEGDLSAESVLIHEGGRFYGQVKTETADVRGTLQGEVAVKNLINIRSSGAVNGNVQYGRLAVEVGGSLSADVRNVPPELFGDFELTVNRGGTVIITTTDITALDPDDAPENVTFSVSNPRGGFVAFSATPRMPIAKFTQADLQGSAVLFVHDGSEGKLASFDVIARDSEGGTSGSPRTVRVLVRSRS